MGEVRGGMIRWKADGSLEARRVAWVHPDLGEVVVEAEVMAGGPAGRVEFSHAPGAVDAGEEVRGRVEFERRDGVWFVPAMNVDLMGQSVSGHLCSRESAPAGLHGRFEAESLDLDRLQQVFASGESSGELPDLSWLNLDVAVGTLAYAGTLAEGVNLRIGTPQPCF